MTITHPNNNQSLFLTVITVVRNGYSILEKTIQSVINQINSNIEYIIIDGASDDNTIDLIKKYNTHVSLWISEPDKGIYDAMNKGISLANGRYTIFLNAGDVFYDENVCFNINRIIEDIHCDVVYGDFIACNIQMNNEIYIKAKPVNKLWMGLVSSHQSVFIRTSVLKKYLFDLSFKIVADYNQVIQIFKANYSFGYTPLTISKTAIGGVSYSNIDTYKEQIVVFRRLYPYSVKVIYFYYLIFIGLIRKILGNKITNVIRIFKWKIIRFYK